MDLRLQEKNARQQPCRRMDQLESQQKLPTIDTLAFQSNETARLLQRKSKEETSESRTNGTYAFPGAKDTNRLQICPILLHIYELSGKAVSVYRNR